MRKSIREAFAYVLAITILITEMIIIVSRDGIIEAKAADLEETVGINANTDYTDNIGSVHYGDSIIRNYSFSEPIDTFSSLSAGFQIVSTETNGEGKVTSAKIKVSTDELSDHEITISFKKDDGIGTFNNITVKYTVLLAHNPLDATILNHTFGDTVGDNLTYTDTDYSTNWYVSIVNDKDPFPSPMPDNPYTDMDGINVPGTYIYACYGNGITGYDGPDGFFKTFTISKATPTLSIADFKSSEKIKVLITAPTTDSPSVTFDFYNDPSLDGAMSIVYAKSGTAEYSPEIPTEPGKYDAKLVCTGIYADWYNDASTTFTILPADKKEGSGTVKVADVVYGSEKIKPVPASETNGTSNVIYYFKLKDAADSTYTKEVPTKPGKYTCMAVFAENDKYKEVKATCNFVIDKGIGVGTLTMPNQYVGEQLKPVPVCKTNGVTNVTYYYKKKGADNSTYSKDVPAEAGEYTVKAVFAMTDYYYQAEATADFRLSYMPAPAFGYQGTLGRNGFYTTDVVIKAPAGYLVSTTRNGSFADSISISEEYSVSKLYFKNKDTGALSDAVNTGNLKIDKSKPVIKNVKDKDTLYGDEVTIKISDSNLEKIFINGEAYRFSGSNADVLLTSNDSYEEYKIEVLDEAGNRIEYTIIVEANWYKEGIVPFGKMIKLKKDKEYKGSSNDFMVEGDGTVYAGGASFYVTEDNEYKFIEK